MLRVLHDIAKLEFGMDNDVGGYLSIQYFQSMEEDENQDQAMEQEMDNSVPSVRMVRVRISSLSR